MNEYDFSASSIHLPVYIYLTTIVSGTKTCNIHIGKSIAIKKSH